MPKYAPARKDGLKPYVVTVKSWGWSYTVIEYADKASQAEYQAKRRQMNTSAKARRATPADLDPISSDTEGGSDDR